MEWNTGGETGQQLWVGEVIGLGKEGFQTGLECEE